MYHIYFHFILDISNFRFQEKVKYLGHLAMHTNVLLKDCSAQLVILRLTKSFCNKTKVYEIQNFVDISLLSLKKSSRIKFMESHIQQI